MYDSASIRRQGLRAHDQGLAREENPYQMTSRSNDGLMKQAFWAAGWDEAFQAAAEKNKVKAS